MVPLIICVMSFLLFFLLLFNSLYCSETNHLHEEILYLHTDIYINFDRSITVQEKIEVYSIGKYIKHGICRNIPKSYNVTNVQKDDSVCPHIITELKGKKRSGNYYLLCINNENIKLDPGIHTYTITYTVKKAVYPLFNNNNHEYTDDFIQWDIKNDTWYLPIKNLSISIYLPLQQPNNQQAIFTSWSNVRSAIIDCSTPNSLIFCSTQPTSLNKTIKLTAAWQKGFVAQPTAIDKDAYTWKLFLSKISIPAALIIIILNVFRLYARRKWLYIRSYEFLENPPNHILPVEAAYLFDGKLSTKSFMATLVDMAQRGYLTIEKTSNNLYIITQTKTTDTIPIYHIIAKELFKKDNSFPFHKKENELTKITKLIKKHCENKEYFEQESIIIMTIMIISGIIFILTLFLFHPISPPQSWPHTHYNYVPLFLVTFMSGLCSLFLGKIPTDDNLTIIKELEKFKLFLAIQPNQYQTSTERNLKPELFEQNFPYAIALDCVHRWSEYVPRTSWYKEHKKNHYYVYNGLMDLERMLYFLLPQLVPWYKKDKYYHRNRNRLIKEKQDWIEWFETVCEKIFKDN